MAGVRRYEDLEAWKLAKELRDAIFKLTEKGPVARNLKFRDQLRRSSSSPPSNIAEGFGRFKPREFAYFVRIARGSLLETRNHIQDGQTKEYFSEEDTDALLKLHSRAMIATTRLCDISIPARAKPQPAGEPPEPLEPCLTVTCP